MLSDFENLFNSLELLLFVLDPNGDILYCNDTACNRLGYTRGELIGMPIVNIHPKEQRMFAGMLLDDMLAGKEDICPIPIQTKSGELIQVHTKVSQGSWQGKPALFGITKDITDLKLIDEKYKTIFHAVPDLISVIDTNYKIMSVNQAMADKMGMSIDDAIGLTCYEAVHDSNCPPTICPNVRLLQDGKTHRAEVYEPRLGGSYLVTVSPIHDGQGKITGSVHIAHDISQIKIAEKKFSTIFQFAPVALAITSIATGQIIDVNDAWLYLTGFWKDDVIGKTVFDLDIYQDINDRDNLIKQLNDNHRVENIPIRMKTKHGLPIYGLFCGAPIMISGVPCWITALNNQTKKVLLEQAIIDFRAKAELVQGLKDGSFVK